MNILTNTTPEQASAYEQVADYVLDRETNTPLLVGINGKDASGKTIFADNLAEMLRTKIDLRKAGRNVIRISFDDYLNKESIRNAVFQDEARGSYENAFNFYAFKQHVLEPLQAGSSWLYRPKFYDLPTDTEVQASDSKALANDIFVIDGLFMYRSDLVPYWGVKIVLDASDLALIERGAARDEARFGSIELAKEKFQTRYLPSQDIYFGEEHPLEHADIIVDNEDVTRPAITHI